MSSPPHPRCPRLQCRQKGTERGSAVIETVIGVPAFLLFVGLIIFAGRMAIAHQAVEAAANSAARSASISRTQGDAEGAASSAASSALASQGLTCASTAVSVDTTGFAAPVGTPAQVTATVTCEVNLADLSAPGVPGSKTVTATTRSAIDTYRER
ncbi:TadE/TadG family type IV pilus assembly protein [Humibacillus xanthopallidus]|uniref:TadE-like protein n=1 Tax=Humibacillus xanthopallidus TaxID=412689 RepID=A0A543HHL5_9MICO|nr:TadE/TadG family type IV pilus assembly protein [Humibacillus xanthopallidus]TQM57818.1 TadE-like protein [Humibacillus xanthopallidus]